MDNKKKESPVVAKKEENEEILSKFIKAKTIMNIGIFLFLFSFIIGLLLMYSLHMDGIIGLCVLVASIIIGVILSVFCAIAAEIVYQLQKINSKK